MVVMLNTQSMLLQLHTAHIRHKLDDAGILLCEVMEMHNLPLKLVQMCYPSHTFQSLRSLYSNILTSEPLFLIQLNPLKTICSSQPLNTCPCSMLCTTNIRHSPQAPWQHSKINLTTTFWAMTDWPCEKLLLYSGNMLRYVKSTTYETMESWYLRDKEHIPWPTIGFCSSGHFIGWHVSRTYPKYIYWMPKFKCFSQYLLL